MFDIYVSAQTADTPRLTKGENLARVVQAYAASTRFYLQVVRLYSVVTADGVWHGNYEPTVILSFDDTHRSDELEDLAEFLRYRLRQESVLVVSDTEIDGWDACYKSERNLGDSYTQRDGMGQRPYAYRAVTLPEHITTHWVRYVNA